MEEGKNGYISQRMPLGRGVKGWVVERPGLHLSTDACQNLVDDLRSVAGKTLTQGELNYGVFDSASNALDNSIITILYDTAQNRPIAFNSMPLLNIELEAQSFDVVHLGLVMIDPQARSAGLSSILYGFACAVLLFRNQFRPIWVSSVTQVPAVFGLVSELYSDTFPSPKSGRRRSFKHLQIARHIMGNYRSAFGVGKDAGFNEDTFVISNAYTGGSDNLKKTFDDAPKHRDQKYNELCKQVLDYERGDDFLQIGRIDVAALRHYIFRTLPETAFGVSILSLVFFGFQFVLLPIRHWFDASKSWGALRPWRI